MRKNFVYIYIILTVLFCLLFVDVVCDLNEVTDKAITILRIILLPCVAILTMRLHGMLKLFLHSEKQLACFSTIIENHNDFISWADSQHRIRYLNKAARKILRVRENDDTQFISNTHPAWAYKKIREEGIPTAQKDGFWRGETAIIDANGNEVPTLQDIQRLDIPEYETFLATIIRDISKEKKHEQSLKVSEEKFRLVFEEATLGIAFSSTTGQYLDANESFCKMVGYTRSELKRMFFSNITLSEDLEQSMSGVQQLLTGEKSSISSSKRYRHKNGNIIWCYVNSFMLRDHNNVPLFYVTHVQDITERRRAEHKLMETERRFRETLERVQSIAVYLDIDGKVIFCNDYLCKITGYKKSEIIGLNWFDTFIPNEREDVKQEFSRAMENGDVTKVYENPLRTKNGELRHVIWSNAVMRTEDGNIEGTVSIGQDITHIKEIEHSLQQSKVELNHRWEEYKRIVDLTLDGILLVNEKGEILYANEVASKLMGYPVDNLVGVAFGYELPEPGTKKFVEICCTDDTEKTVEIASIPTTWFNKQAIMIVMHDISHFKQLEILNKELSVSRQREMAAIIAGGVAHDLNNLLGATIGLPDILLKQDLPAEQKEILGVIKSSGEKAVNIVQDLLEISRPQSYLLSPTRLNNVLRSYAHSFEFVKLTKKYPMVSVCVKYDKQSKYCVNGSETHLYKLLMNLTKNAFEAMENKGFLVMETGHKEFAEPMKGLFNIIPAGNYCYFRVSDEGSGISSADLQHIFEPFFTCHKPCKESNGSGSGLGLSVVKSVIERHGAYITLFTKVGTGTEFIVYFPTIEHDFDLKKPVEKENIAGNGSVIVVDDIPEQRYVARAILSELGYDVTVASNGEEFKDKSVGKTFDVMVIDARLNGHGSGLLVWQEAKRSNPKLRGVMITGYKTENIEKDAYESGIQSVVSKPFTIATLGKAIKDCLGEKTDAS